MPVVVAVPVVGADCAMATVSVKVHAPVFAKVSESVPVTV